MYAYSQQANLTVERDLGHGYALSLAYNFNGGRHLNRPINANTIRGDLMVSNFQAAYYDASGGRATYSGESVHGQRLQPGRDRNSALPLRRCLAHEFLPPRRIESVDHRAYGSIGDPLGCIAAGCRAGSDSARIQRELRSEPPFNGCVPFGDMDANYSNGSSIYHGFTANLRKRFTGHLEFLASYTWSHAIDDSTDLQSTLTPQDSYYPAYDRSTSLFDQRHRFVFSGVYQTGKLGGSGFVSKVFSDWTDRTVVDVSSGRPFNIITGNGDNLQLSSLTGRPNTTVNPACGPTYKSKYSPTGVLAGTVHRRFHRHRSNPNSAWHSTATWDATRESRPGRCSTICASPSGSTSASASAWT